MKFNPSKGWIKCVFSRVAILYVAAVVFFFGCLNFEKLYSNAKAATLSRLMPSYFDYMVQIETNPKAALDRKKIAPYVHYYEKVADFVPQIPDVHCLLGFSYYALGSEKKAISSFRRSMALNPRFITPYYDLGLIYFKKNSYREAMYYFNKAVRTNPVDYLEFVSSSRLFFPLFVNTDMDVLGKDLVRKLKERYFDAYYLLAISYYHLGQYPEMLNFSIDALAKVQDQAPFYYLAGLAAYNMKEYKDAVVFFQKVLAFEPQFSEAYHYLGLCWEELGKKEMSLKALQRAVFLRQQQTPSPLPDEKEFSLFLY